MGDGGVGAEEGGQGASMIKQASHRSPSRRCKQLKLRGCLHEHRIVWNCKNIFVLTMPVILRNAQCTKVSFFDHLFLFFCEKKKTIFFGYADITPPKSSPDPQHEQPTTSKNNNHIRQQTCCR